MALKDSAKLEKLKIYVREARDSGGGNKSYVVEPNPSFEAMFNPESFSTSHGNVYHQRSAINLGSTFKRANYHGSDTDRLSLTFTLDSTGAADFGIGFKHAGVKSQVDKFLTTCLRYESKIHEPKPLHIRWGIINFDCRLESVEINYTSFDRSGMPLRAELSTVFIGDQDTVTDVREESPNSPDLSHSRVVKHGDTLPLLAREIYGSSRYYLRLAQANGLDDFRNLTPGQEIIFPPLEK